MGQGDSKMTEIEADFDLLFIGKTGHGKSATANTIVGAEVFKESCATTSETKKIDYHFCKHGGINIKVVDAPGVADTELNKEEDLKQLEERFANAMIVSPKGYHAFLLVFAYGARFTKEEVYVVQCLKEMFGPDFVRNHCIMVVTNGDRFENDMIAKRVPQFSKYCLEQTGHFGEIFEECSRRAVLFNNREKNKKIRIEQVCTLIKMIEDLGGERYVNENFERARELRGLMTVREETEREQEFINEELTELSKLKAPQRLGKLKELLARAENVRDEARKDDKESELFKLLLEGAEAQIREIQSNIELYDLYGKNEKEAEQRKAEFMGTQRKERTTYRRSAAIVKQEVIRNASSVGKQVVKQRKEKGKVENSNTVVSSALSYFARKGARFALKKVKRYFSQEEGEEEEEEEDEDAD